MLAMFFLNNMSKRLYITALFLGLGRFFSFLNYLLLRIAPGPGVYSDSKRSEFQKEREHISGEQTAAGA
jgi:hypothetical protein